MEKQNCKARWTYKRNISYTRRLLYLPFDIITFFFVSTKHYHRNILSFFDIYTANTSVMLWTFFSSFDLNSLSLARPPFRNFVKYFTFPNLDYLHSFLCFFLPVIIIYGIKNRTACFDLFFHFGIYRRGAWMLLQLNTTKNSTFYKPYRYLVF